VKNMSVAQQNRDSGTLLDLLDTAD